MDFTQHDLIGVLDAAAHEELDQLSFGVIKLDPSGRVLAYNLPESSATGLSRERVLGRHFFTEVGPCMNNALVAGRFALESELDAELDYVFTQHLRPEPVRLRLLKSADSPSMYLLVRR